MRFQSAPWSETLDRARFRSGPRFIYSADNTDGTRFAQDVIRRAIVTQFHVRDGQAARPPIISPQRTTNDRFSPTRKAEFEPFAKPRRRRRTAWRLILPGPFFRGLAKGSELCFPGGENLSFVVRWGLIIGGRASLSIPDMELRDNRPAYHILSEARSVGIVSAVYKTRTGTKPGSIKSLDHGAFEAHPRGTLQD